MIAGPRWGLGAPKKISGAKNWKIAIGAYSYELITPERKRISERLKRLWNRKRMAYKATFDLDLWLPDVNTVSAFARTGEKKFQVYGDSLKIICCNPPSNIHGKQSPCCSKSVENFVNLNE